jgi:hypothetical protein
MNNGRKGTLFLTIVLSLFAISLTLLIPILSYFVISLLFYASMSILFLIGFILLTYALHEPISSFRWRRRYIRRLKKNKIGILKEERCSRNATDFSPSYWLRQISDLYNPVYISSPEINENFVAIINPYGEVYREDDYTNLLTLRKIREYVQKGGIFINPGGVAFWLAWNKKWKRRVSTAKEIYGFGGPFLKNQQGALAGISLTPTVQIGNYSLTETVTYSNFKLLTTVGIQRTLVAFQTDIDKEFCGDIESINGRKNIIEFRAAREPLPKSYPMLRATMVDVHNRKSTIFPMIAVPDGKGLFIFAGMAFDYNNKKVKIPKRTAEDQAKRVIKSLGHIIDNKILLKIHKGEL